MKLRAALATQVFALLLACNSSLAQSDADTYVDVSIGLFSDAEAAVSAAAATPATTPTTPAAAGSSAEVRLAERRYLPM
jgi:hypothetical protein